MAGPNVGEMNSGASLRLFREFAEYAPNDNSQARLTESSSPFSRGLTSHDVSGTGSKVGRGFERFTRTVGGFFQLLGHKILPGKVAAPEKNRQVRECFVAAIRSELSSAGIDWRTDIPKAIRDQFKNEMETNTPLTRRRIKQVLSKVDNVLAYKNGQKAANASVGAHETNLADLKKAGESLNAFDTKVKDLKIGSVDEDVEEFEKTKNELLEKVASLKSRLEAAAEEVEEPVNGLTEDEDVDLGSASDDELADTSYALSRNNVERRERNDRDRAKIGALLTELKDLEAQYEKRFALPKASEEEGKVSIRPQTLSSNGYERKSSDVRKDVREQVLAKIPGFDEWVKGLAAAIAEKVGLKGSAWTYFQKVWEAETVVGPDKDLIAEKAVAVLKAAQNKQNPEKIELDVAELKSEIEKALVKRYEDEAKSSGWQRIDAAEEMLKKLSEASGLVAKVKEYETDRIGRAVDALQNVLSENARKALKEKMEGECEKYLSVLGQKTLLEFDNTSDGGRTLFNRLVAMLTPKSKDAASKSRQNLYAYVGKIVDEVAASYRLDKGNTGNVRPNLKPMRSGDKDTRVVQRGDESPYEIVQTLLKQKPGERAGLVQSGGLSCWMVSVVNGLLNSGKGRDILRDCFKPDGSCVFKARNKEGKLQEIEVSKARIDAIMNSRQGKTVSRLEAAIWLGVNIMTEEKKNDFTNVKGCNLGDMGEASDVATLFGLVNKMKDGRTGAFDDDSVWVSGSNSLHKGEIVVVHRRSKGANDGGHYMAIVGSELTRGVVVPEKSFGVYDSLQHEPTETIRHDQLNSIEDEEADRYKVFAFAFPERDL